MRTTLKRLIKFSAGYSVVTLLGPLFTLFLTPVYTRILNPADYGAIDIAVALGSFLTALVTLGLDQALSVHYFDSKQQEKRLVISALTLALGVGIATILGLVLSATQISQWLYRGDAYRTAIIYVIAGNALASAIYAILLAWHRLRMDIRKVNFMALTYLLTLIAFNILFIVVLRYRATGVVAAGFFANAAACGVGVWMSRSLLSAQPSKNYLHTLARTGVGILPGVAAYLVLSGIDRLMLTQYVSLEEQGWYGIANKLASMMYVLAGASLSAWQPMALEMSQQPEAPKQFARIFEVFLVGSMFVALGIGLFAPQILITFTRPAYLPAAGFALVLLAYTGPISFAASLFSIGLYVKKQTHWLSVTLIVSAATNIALNLLLCPKWGAWGATWATLIAGLIFMAGNSRFAQRAFPVPYRWARLCVLSVIFAAIVLAGILLPSAEYLFVKAGLLGLFCISSFVLGMVTLEHVRMGSRFLYTKIAARSF